MKAFRVNHFVINSLFFTNKYCLVIAVVHTVDIKCCLTLSIYVVTLYYLLVKIPNMQYVGLTLYLHGTYIKSPHKGKVVPVLN